MSRIAVALGALLLAAGSAAGNGRPAETTSIVFGPDGAVAASTTFGLVVSSDGGGTWRWTCEDALGYGGEYDPALAYADSGALFSTSLRGIMRTDDHCTVAPATPLGGKLASTIARGPDGALFAAIAEPANASTMSPGDAAIYKSTDGGATFPTSATPSPPGTWWYSVAVAPSDPQRIYASGFRVELGVRELKLYRSLDGGASYQPLAATGIATSPSSALLLVGVSAQDPDVVYARVTFHDNAPNSDAIVRSVDGGATWTEVLARPTSLSAVVRASGDLVVANRYAEAWISRAPSRGDAWEALPGAPHVSCLVETRAGEVWACTQNYAPSDETRDGAGIMKSTDLASWTKVLTYQDIAGPIACPVGTVQRDTCVDDAQRWCTMRRQFGIVADPTGCPALVDAAPPPDAPSAPGGGGCCDAGAGSFASAWLVLVIALRSRHARRAKTAQRLAAPTWSKHSQ